MPRLSEVVGGVLRGLIDSRVGADTLSRELAEHYRLEPVLSQVPVPRFSVKNVTLRLRFAVQGVQGTSPSPEDLEAVGVLWASEVTERVLPEALRAAGVASAAAARLVEKLRTIERGRPGLTDVSALAPNRLSALTVNWILAGRAALPPTVLGELPGIRKLRDALRGELAAAAEAFAPRGRRILEDRAVLRSELTIAVDRAELEQVPESQIHELTIALAADDLVLTAVEVVPEKGGPS
jgi:hypothetical protein